MPDQLNGATKFNYNFDDWLNSEFITEKLDNGDYVANDSENYLHLVSSGKMSYDELNKI